MELLERVTHLPFLFALFTRIFLLMPTGLRLAPPEIMSIVGRLIAAHFPHLATARLVVMVRQQAETADDEEGKVTVAAAGVNSEGKSVAPFDYLIWFALDAWQLMNDGDHEALVYHELKHCGRDATGRPELTPHDAGIFDSEIERYGLWWQDAQVRFKQARAAGESS